MKYCKNKHSCEVCANLMQSRTRENPEDCPLHMSVPWFAIQVDPPPQPNFSSSRRTLPPAAYSRSLEQCLAKPAGLRRQGESPEGWTIRQFQDHEALNQSRQGTLIKQPSPAQPTNPHRAIKSIPSKTLWNLSGENCRGVRERRETGRGGEGRGGKYHKIHLEKKNRKNYRGNAAGG